MLLAEDVDSLDPQRAAQPPAWGLLRAMHRGLMAFPAKPFPDGARPEPDLAQTPPAVSPDGLRYTFRLREGPAFGPPLSRPVRAADVKAGIERAITAASPIAVPLKVVTGIAAPDERTVVITLARPVNDLLWLLAVPATSAVPPGLPAATTPDRFPASGPYRLADGGYRPERGIKLVRNEAWDRDSDPIRAAWVDEILVEIGVAPAEIQGRLLDGRADLSGDVPAGPTPGVPAARLVRAPNGCLRYLFMNTRVAPFTSRAVRGAVASVAPRAEIAATYDGAAVAAASILPPTVDGFDPGSVAPTPDPAAARAALASAGFRSGITARLIVGDQPADRAQADLVRRGLAAAGVRIDVRAVPIASLYEDHYEVPAARVPMGIATWCADWPGLGGRGALTPLVDGRAIAARGSTNYAQLASPGLNAALDGAAIAGDPGSAGSEWRTADAAARGLAAVVPLAFLSESSLLGPDVRGFVAHPYFVRGDLTAVWLDRS